MVLTEDKTERTQTHLPNAYKLVEPHEYCELAISLRRMTRCDDPDSGLRMLLDNRTGQRFAVEDYKLAKYLYSRI